MVQGTGSDAGKSLLCAGLCRILKRAGYKVAPFKAQNMSLNSHVTLDGREMGRAQALQAAACGLDPDVRMNPVLLKPSSETGSQVILLGKAIGHMGYGAYSELKEEIIDKIHSSYDALANDHDVIVIEGAGSPVEINLKERDIVNMHMAEYAGAKVLLVGDIERGGIFAAFVGTMELFTERERERVAGFVINRFRGDATLLQSGIDYLQFRTGRPVLGTIPFIRDLGLPLHRRPARFPEVQKLFEAGGIPLVLISSWRIYGERFPHWVVITGFEERFIYAHDPFVDASEGETVADCINMPIARAEFERMARYGRSGQRAVLVVRPRRNRAAGSSGRRRS